MTVSNYSPFETYDLENQLLKDECADSHSYTTPAVNPLPKTTVSEISDIENQTIKDACAAESYNPNSVSRIENFWSKITVSLPRSADSSSSGYPPVLYALLLIVATPLFAFCYGMLYVSGHRFAEQHETFSEVYRMYSRPRFIIGLEFIVLLTAYQIYGPQNSEAFVRFGISAMWFLVVSWIFAPFFLNPCQFDWDEQFIDSYDWTYWMSGSGWYKRWYRSPCQCWESWWDEQQKQCDGFCRRLLEIILSLRFFVYRYVVMYMLRVTNNDKTVMGYSLSWSWLVIVGSMIIFKIVSVWMKKLDIFTMWRICRILKILTLFAFMLSILFFPYTPLTVGDVFSSLSLAFFPTGWAITEIARAWKPLIEYLRMWQIVEALSWGYEAVMGLVIRWPLKIFAEILYVLERRPLPEHSAIALLGLESLVRGEGVRPGQSSSQLADRISAEFLKQECRREKLKYKGMRGANDAPLPTINLSTIKLLVFQKSGMKHK